jgi:hypothetical protein
MRRAAKIDTTQREIVNALRKIGAQVWIIKQPCDLLTYYRGRWMPLECKSIKRLRNDQKQQNDFLADTQTPIVRSPEDAIEAVIYPYVAVRR